MSVQTDRSITGNVVRNTFSVHSFLKRLLDVTFVSLALLLLLPLLLGITLVLWATQGRPIIYRHRRLGLNGRHFQCLKFRSMVKDADKILPKYLRENPQAAEEWAKFQKLQNDPRVTRFGHFLRRSSLDELPQLYNILIGDMSLVGPRPIVDAELKDYGHSAAALLSVRPGLTGPWQVSGRSNTCTDTRVKLDLAYIESRTLSGDLMIIVKTVPAVLGQRGSI